MRPERRTSFNGAWLAANASLIKRRHSAVTVQPDMSTIVTFGFRMSIYFTMMDSTSDNLVRFSEMAWAFHSASTGIPHWIMVSFCTLLHGNELASGSISASPKKRPPLFCEQAATGVCQRLPQVNDRGLLNDRTLSS